MTTCKEERHKERGSLKIQIEQLLLVLHNLAKFCLTFLWSLIFHLVSLPHLVSMFNLYSFSLPAPSARQGCLPPLPVRISHSPQAVPSLPFSHTLPILLLIIWHWSLLVFHSFLQDHEYLGDKGFLFYIGEALASALNTAFSHLLIH